MQSGGPNARVWCERGVSGQNPPLWARQMLGICHSIRGEANWKSKTIAVKPTRRLDCKVFLEKVANRINQHIVTTLQTTYRRKVDLHD